MGDTKTMEGVPKTINKNHLEILQTLPDGWMLRECESYKKEMKSCYALKSRFYQFYIHGRASDCSNWEESFHDCKSWTRYADLDAANRVIQHEKERIKTRLSGHFENNVWEKRSSPPEDWEAPLPDWFKERQKTSNLKKYFPSGEENPEKKEIQDESWLLSQVDEVKHNMPTCSIM